MSELEDDMLMAYLKQGKELLKMQEQMFRFEAMGVALDNFLSALSKDVRMRLPPEETERLRESVRKVLDGERPTKD